METCDFLMNCKWFIKKPKWDIIDWDQNKKLSKWTKIKIGRIESRRIYSYQNKVTLCNG